MSFKRKTNRKDGGIDKKNQIMKGKPATCHPDKVIFARGLCKNCYNKWLLKNNPDYAAKQKKNCQEWSKNNKDKIKENSKNYVKRRVKDDPQYHSIKNLRQYGMTIDDYDNMLKEQGGGCAICGREPGDRRLHVDHCHDTGVVRGLLCFRCNFGLSYFSEDVDVFERAFLYLKNRDNLLKKFNKKLSDKVLEDEKIKKQEEMIFAVAKTKSISEEEKEEMAKLYDAGERLCDIVRMFPQYSRSAVNRAAKRQTRSQKRV